jgi:hypothetical protein
MFLKNVNREIELKRYRQYFPCMVAEVVSRSQHIHSGAKLGETRLDIGQSPEVESISNSRVSMFRPARFYEKAKYCMRQNCSKESRHTTLPYLLT